MAYNKTPALKKAEKKIDQLTGLLETIEREVEALKTERDAYKKIAADFQNGANELLKNEAQKVGREIQSKVALNCAIGQAHAELCTVKPNEHDCHTLQRVIGSVQGLLSCAVGIIKGEVEMLDLYPEQRHADARLRRIEEALK